MRLAIAVGAAAVVLSMVLASCGLLDGRPVGTADNGDGIRLYCGAGLVPTTPDGRANWKGGVVLTFRRAAPCTDPIPSPAELILRAAVHGGSNPWSLTRIGWLYAILTALVCGCAAWAAARAAPLRVLALVPPVLPLADSSFTRFFLSTYSEPAGLLGCVALCCGTALVCVTRREHRAERIAGLLLTAGGGVLAATAKTAYAPVLAIALLVCVTTAVAIPGGRRRWYDRVGPIVMAVAAIVATAPPTSSALTWQARHYRGINAYDLIFTTVLPAVPNATTALGLPTAALAHAGEAYFGHDAKLVPGEKVIAARPDAEEHAAWRLLAAHPGAALHAVGIAMQATRGDALTYLPSRPWTPRTVVPANNPPSGAQGATGATLRAWLDGMSMPWLSSLLAVLGMVAGIVGVAWRRRPWSWFARIAGTAALSVVLLAVAAVAGDGYFEIAKHVWLAAYLLDVTVVALAGGAAALLIRRLGAALHIERLNLTQPLPLRRPQPQDGDQDAGRHHTRRNRLDHTASPSLNAPL